MLERFSALVHKIYEGATDPSAWPGIVAAVADSLEAEKGLLITAFDPPDKGGFIFPHGISQDQLELWATRYQSADLWSRRTAERGFLREGCVVLAQDLTSEAELLESQWYREFLSRVDIFQLVGGIVFDGGHAEYPATGCTLYRGRSAMPFGEQHRAQLKLLVPHLSRALGVMLKLRDAEFRVAASLHALNRIRCGILLLDERGKVCFANSVAESILQQEDGLRLVSHAHSLASLICDDAVAQASLEQALQSSLQTIAGEVEHFTHVIPVRRPSGLPNYAVQLSYLPQSNPYQSGARAVLFIKDGSMAAKPEPDFLQRVYGLTQAEVRAALVLCDGGGMDAVAAQLNVTVNTLKTHLKSIYAKTSVDNRAALTKLMLSLGSA